jgi:hypothetical protein
MALINATTQTATTPINAERFRLLAAIPIVLGLMSSFLGTAWDFQWHGEVGPDTFFTLPHLALYSGVAIAGLTSLMVTLMSTWSYQKGNSIFPEKDLTFVWPVFRVPASFIITGLGSAIFLFFGLYDEIWHRTFGFDVTVVSPPHQGLLFAIMISMMGCLSVFAAAKVFTNQPGQWRLGGRTLGISATVAVMMVFMPVFTPLLPAVIPFPNMFELGTAGAFTIGLLLVSSATKQPGVATLMALCVLALRSVAWFIAPWATRVYADSLGLFIRDGSTGFPEFASYLPSYFIVVAVLVDAFLWFGKRRNLPVRAGVMIVGSLATLLLVLPIQFAYFIPWGQTFNPIVLPVALLVGAFNGWFGWKLGAVLNRMSK